MTQYVVSNVVKNTYSKNSWVDEIPRDTLKGSDMFPESLKQESEFHLYEGKEKLKNPERQTKF